MANSTNDSISNFNDMTHRVESASAMFQKGIYHLYYLTQENHDDEFGIVLRKYQAIFQLCLAQLLLDNDFDLDKEKVKLAHRLKLLCKDPKNPTREYLDPASLITHSMIENKWRGFDNGHPLHLISKKSLTSYKKIVDARHNLVYRPFLLHPLYWEDCTLMSLLENVPESKDLEELYTDFVQALKGWMDVEKNSRIANYFLEQLFMVFKDRSGSRPKETIFMTYARMLSKGNFDFQKLKNYRNNIIDVIGIKDYGINLLEDWNAGEL